ncbi:MAG: hypothetical protein COA52_14820 [Hyphomicrobiales bacterium]|nr:hemerythrin domain-containing protein [Hyphomicrobiales bacterium]PCJ86765.1 MAG: hypothetical protein COA52_14820 [Hyphomicrobiales bacterium]
MPTNDTGPSNDTGGASDHSKKPEPGLIATVSVELLQRLHAHHSSQLTLCDELEEIADSLPDQIDYIRCMRAAKMLDPAVRYAHRFEELELFPLLANSERTSVELQRSLQRLRFEHLEDESFAEELADKLLDIAEGRIVPSGSTEQAELLGYMLRGFFEGLRRHIAFERDHILSRIGTIN